MTDLGLAVPPVNARLTGLSVIVVEDHALVAQSLRLAFRAEGAHVYVIDLAEPAAMILECQARHPDVVLLDLDLGEFGDGQTLIEEFTAIGATVVVLTGSDDVARLGACIEAGAIGIIAKTEDLDVLVEHVRRAARGERLMSAQRKLDLLVESRHALLERKHRLAPFASLTERESQVLAEMMRGFQADEIGLRLFVSETTVRTHVRAILLKLGVRSQLAAVARARDAGWQLGARCHRNEVV